MSGSKQPVSVLVLIHSPELDILLLERAAHPGFWQSVTGSREANESLRETARRELAEETGLQLPAECLVDWRLSNTFEIFPQWRHRYPAGVTHNVEHVFSVCIERATPIITAPDEHRDHVWLPWQEAAGRCFSWSNRDAILLLAEQAVPAS